MTDDIVRRSERLIGGEVVSTYEDEDGDAVDIRVRLPETLRQNPDQVRDLRLAVADRNGAATLLPLANLVSYDRLGHPVGDQPPGAVPPGDDRRESGQSPARNGRGEGPGGRGKAGPGAGLPGRLYGRGGGHGRILRLHGRVPDPGGPLRLLHPGRPVRIVPASPWRSCFRCRSPSSGWRDCSS